MDAIKAALQEGRLTLSEYESKLLLASYQIPVAKESLVSNHAELDAAMKDIGFPLVLKGASAEISHKTEKGLVLVDIRTAEEARRCFHDLMGSMPRGAQVLVQEMVSGKRELLAGLTRDPQFGPCVMFGLGGIFTEILNDVTFRVAPLSRRDAADMMGEIRARKILDAIRGMEEVNREALANILINLGKIGLDHDVIKEIDINPLIVRNGTPIAVDALVVLDGKPRA
jgi:acetyl-CoA synthetase (ADP-forming)